MKKTIFSLAALLAAGTYTATAENIAYNSYDPVELFNQWWNSSGHRKNMMNPSYTKVGIGVVYGNGNHCPETPVIHGFSNLDVAYLHVNVPP